MKKWKKPLLFALGLLPIAAVAGYFSILYQFGIVDEATQALLLEQLGSREAVIAVYIVQIMGYAFFCGFFGHLLAEKLGLRKPFGLKWGSVKPALLLGTVVGIVLALDYWTFGAVIPGIRAATDDTLNPVVLAASVLYGGIVEELMLRWFFMSLLAWLIWKLFSRKAETVPEGALIAANVLAAVLFAAGHLPATQMLFGTLTPLLLLRCFLLNGGAGLVFGWLYRKHGIQYAMLAHAGAHIVSKLIWWIFV